MSYAIGVGLACLASVMNATGINLQRLAQRRGSASLNVLGVALATLCGVVDMVSFSFAPQSLLAPFGAVTLVVNLMLAPLLHGDAIYSLDLLSTALVMAGVATMLSAASPSMRSWSLPELEGLLLRRPFHYWLMVQALMIGFASTVVLRGGSRRRSAAPCFAVIAGLFGGCTVLSAKLLSELLNGGAAWPRVALAAVSTGACALSQLLTLNAGVGRHSSLVVVPVFTATFVFVNAMGGGSA